MSECVVRMEMPEKCAECPAWSICGTLHKYMLGIDCDSDWTYDDLLVITVETGLIKPDNCPIICSLPEGHGRLVDADAFEKDVSDALVYGLKEIPSEEGKQIFHVLMQEVLDNVKKRKTIVPAERSDA